MTEEIKSNQARATYQQDELHLGCFELVFENI